MAFTVIGAVVSAGNIAARTPPLRIANVAVSRGSFNPRSGASVALTVTLNRTALLDVEVVDRDGYVIRTFAPIRAAAGANNVTWDGKDAAGDVVADEAYSFRVIAKEGRESADYFPAAHNAPLVSIDPLAYSRPTSTLTYELPVASRVHIQAGTMSNDASHPTDGAVLRTVVNREPRPAGKIAEHWNGFDESTSVYVPDLRGFGVAIAASPLPENSVIAYGNATRSFLEYAQHRNGQSLMRHQGPSMHHVGLDVFNDVAPKLVATPSGVYHAEERR